MVFLLAGSRRQNDLSSYARRISCRLAGNSRSDEETVADYWNGLYLNSESMLWGRTPSKTATSLIGLINKERERFGQQIKIIEPGCGYGRDTAAFAKAGFDVLAIDIARNGLVLAQQDYRKMSVPGRVRFLHGTITTALAATDGQFDGLSCHRTIHLGSRESVLNFARCAAKLVRPGGFISIGARSPKDFDPETMSWVKGRVGQTARYSDPSRNRHLLTFLDEPYLRLCVEPHFSVEFSEGIEPERISKRATTALIFVTGTRRFEG
jgi:SAM-dependent methyltransferase